ncbi:MAG: copper amine oxidase N-terminal domain-containing protein [Cellulosilyticaceae bacterium]
MKKKAFSKFVVIGLSVWASASSVIFANDESTKFFINGEKRYDAEIVLKNDTTYVPLRIVGEELGAKVNYDSQNKSILVSKDSISLQMRIGNKEALLNGEPFSLSNEILMHTTSEGTQLTYIPLRNIFETFDGVVAYNKEHNYVNAYNKDNLTYTALEGLKSEDLTTYRFAQLALPRVGATDMSLTGGRVVEYIFPVNTKTDYFFIRIDPSGDMDVTSIAYMEVENGVAICKWYKELNGEIKENINPLDNAINRSLGARGVTREVGEFPNLEETNFIYFVEHNMMQPSPQDEAVPLYEEKFESMIGVLTPQGGVGVTKNLIGEMRWSPYADTYIRQGYDGEMYTYWKNAILLSEVEESSFVGAVPEDTTYLYGNAYNGWKSRTFR